MCNPFVINGLLTAVTSSLFIAVYLGAKLKLLLTATGPPASTSLSAKAEFSKSTDLSTFPSIPISTDTSEFHWPLNIYRPSGVPSTPQHPPNADKFTGSSTFKSSGRFIRFIRFREAGEVQGIGEVGDADGIRYWPVVARRPVKSVMPVVVGKSLKLVKSLDAGDGKKAGEVFGCL